MHSDSHGWSAGKVAWYAGPFGGTIRREFSRPSGKGEMTSLGGANSPPARTVHSEGSESWRQSGDDSVKRRTYAEGPQGLKILEMGWASSWGRVLG